jgi:t-SNARE complex subunit (syntaxin)
MAIKAQGEAFRCKDKSKDNGFVKSDEEGKKEERNRFRRKPILMRPRGV